MAKKTSNIHSNIAALINIALWLTGVIVSLSVGFAMADGKLTLPTLLGGPLVASIAGWIVIILTLLSVILAIVEKLS